MKNAAVWLALGGLFLSLRGEAALYRAQYSEDAKGRRVLESFGKILGDEDRLTRAVTEQSYPRFIGEHVDLDGGTIVELESTDPGMLRGMLKARGVVEPKKPQRRATDEVFTLVANGPPANRIDLVFMGDGYTAAEKPKFLADIQRLVDDIFKSDTYASYRALFNVHAVFRPSVESGIGKNDKPKNTAYRLYRQGDTLRAILPGDSSAASNSCSKAPDCDYPILVANDPYYGGLGGQFAITTSSTVSGAIVLRHELGHNFGRVGEEYDGGEATFFGANFSSAAKVGWAHWLKPGAKPEKSKAHFVDWPWKNLAGGAFTADFESTGSWDSRAIRFSASGVETDKDIEVTLDGEVIPITSPGSADRTFYDLKWKNGFSKGSHELKFASGVNDGNNFLSSLTIHEYDKDFDFDEEHVGIFPNFTKSGTIGGYRATNETCLMRNMSSRHFCPVCQENNWLKFFSKVSVADELRVTRPSAGRVQVELVTPPLPHLKVEWFKNGQSYGSLDGEKKWELDEKDAKGDWEVRVRFETPEVRKDPSGLLKASKKTTI